MIFLLREFLQAEYKVFSQVRKNDQYIKISYDGKVLEKSNKQTKGSKIKITLFISVIEDITKVVEVKKIEENQAQNDLQN